MNASAEAKARWLFTGFLLLVAAAAAAWYLFGAVRYGTYELRTRDSVSGLLPGAPVEFHGVEVGKVESVQLLEPRLVQVLVQVRREIPLTSATVATITGRGLATRGFTGYMYVSLEDSGGGRPLAAAPGQTHAMLTTAPSRIVSLDTTMGELSQSVQAVNTLLQSTLDQQTVATLKQSLASLEKVTHTLADNNARMERILANAERASQQLQAGVLPQAQGTLARMDRLTAKVDGLATTMDAQVKTILRNTEQASARFEPLLQAGTDTFVTLQTQVLPEAQRTLVRMDQLTTALGDTAGRIQRNPSLLVRGSSPAPLGPGEGP